MYPNDDSNQSNNPYASPLFPAHPPLKSKDDGITHEDINPWITVWFRPRDTVRWIIATNPQLHVLLLASLSGIGSAFDRASTRDLGNHFPLAAIIAMVCVLGPLGGLFSLWLSSHLIRLTGAWIGGKGNREYIKTAIAWAWVPAVVALLVMIVQIILFGSDMFTTDTPRIDSQPIFLILLFVFVGVQVVLGIWQSVLLCNTVAEVQEFRSAWLGLANILLAGAVVVIPVMIIAAVLILSSL